MSTEPELPALKPCPFCGTPFGLHGYKLAPYPHPKVEGLWCIYCEACTGYVTSDTAESVVDVWNSRPAEDALREALSSSRDVLAFALGSMKELRDIHIGRWGDLSLDKRERDISAACAEMIGTFIELGESALAKYPEEPKL